MTVFLKSPRFAVLRDAGAIRGRALERILREVGPLRLVSNFNAKNRPTCGTLEAAVRSAPGTSDPWDAGGIGTRGTVK